MAQHDRMAGKVDHARQQSPLCGLNAQDPNFTIARPLGRAATVARYAQHRARSAAQASGLQIFNGTTGSRHQHFAQRLLPRRAYCAATAQWLGCGRRMSVRRRQRDGDFCDRYS